MTTTATTTTTTVVVVVLLHISKLQNRIPPLRNRIPFHHPLLSPSSSPPSIARSTSSKSLLNTSKFRHRCSYLGQYAGAALKFRRVVVALRIL